MSSPTVIVLALVLPVTVMALVVVLWRLGRRIRASYDEAVGTYTRLEPVLAQLQESAAVAQREADAVSASLDRLSTERAQRREHR